MVELFQLLYIKKPSAGIEKEYRYFDTQYYTVPNVIDYDVVEARKILDKFTVEFSGTGNNVISMSPNAGSRVSEGSTIRLMLG